MHYASYFDDSNNGLSEKHAMYGGPIRPDIHSHLTNIFTRATLAVCMSVASQSSIETSEWIELAFGIGTSIYPMF